MLEEKKKKKKTKKVPVKHAKVWPLSSTETSIGFVVKRQECYGPFIWGWSVGRENNIPFDPYRPIFRIDRVFFFLLFYFIFFIYFPLLFFFNRVSGVHVSFLFKIRSRINESLKSKISLKQKIHVVPVRISLGWEKKIYLKNTQRSFFPSLSLSFFFLYNKTTEKVAHLA